MKGPVPPHLRNPRRWYKDGIEQPPATVRSSRAIGHNSTQVYCHDCQHKVMVCLDGMAEDQAIIDIPIDYRLICRCGSKNIGVQMDVALLYDLVRMRLGHESELPEIREMICLLPRRGA